MFPILQETVLSIRAIVILWRKMFLIWKNKTKIFCRIVKD